MYKSVPVAHMVLRSNRSSGKLITMGLQHAQTWRGLCMRNVSYYMSQGLASVGPYDLRIKMFNKITISHKCDSSVIKTIVKHINTFKVLPK